MAFGPIGEGENPQWPYDDLVLRSPRCPWCGFTASLLVGTSITPRGLCLTADCRVMSFDPTRTWLELVDDLLYRLGKGSIEWTEPTT